MCIFRMYPYPSYGAAGPVSGGLRGRQGRVLDAGRLEDDREGKGVKKSVVWAGATPPLQSTPTKRHVNYISKDNLVRFCRKRNVEMSICGFHDGLPSLEC